MNNDLTAKVKLDGSQAERAIDNLCKKLDTLTKSVDKIANAFARQEEAARRANEVVVKTTTNLEQATVIADGLTNSFTRSADAVSKVADRAGELSNKFGLLRSPLTFVQGKLDTIATSIRNARSATYRWLDAHQRIKSILAITSNKLSSVGTKVRTWWTNQKLVQSATKSTNSLLDGTLTRLRGIAATYLGIMGTKAIINVSDTMTSAENKLNYTNATALGASGYNADGSYSAKTLSMTQETMDKMYASSQKVRMSYTDMMTSVSKMMALAGDAFQGNTDNAIRFQEIMAEAYTVGGASAQEMSSSMYQLTQALGAGVLAGDELRSVREGAPLAYKAIEEFAQGVYNTTDSLKDMGSQGLITSEMVVAAIMNAGTEMDNAFAQTYYRFDQVWTQIQNAAKYAFKPVSEMLRNMLNDAVDNGLIKSVEEFMTVVSKTTQVVVTVIGNAMNWVLEHWNYVKAALIAGLTTLVILLTSAAVAGIAKWVATHWQLMLVATAIFGIVYALQLWQQGAINTCQVMTAVLAIITAGLLILAAINHSIVLLIAAGIVFVATLMLMFFEQICGAAWVALTFVGNLFQSLGNFIVTIFMLIGVTIGNVFAFIVNLTMGVVNVVIALGQCIGNAIHNGCEQGKIAFWSFVKNLLDGTGLIAQALNKIASVFGLDTVSIDTKINAAKGNLKKPVSIEDAWSKGWNTVDFGSWSDAYNLGKNFFGTGLGDWSASNAYNTGFDFGSGVKDNINNLGAGLIGKVGDKLGGLTNLDNIANKLGLDLSTQTGAFPNANDAAYATGSGYNPELLKGVGGIGNDTSRIADSMELTEEDLEYLKRAAELEWKKEYTIAEIVVDMTNHNNISKDMDIDTMYGKLTDKLYEELATFADGVYA